MGYREFCLSLRCNPSVYSQTASQEDGHRIEKEKFDVNFREFQAKNLKMLAYRLSRCITVYSRQVRVEFTA